MAQHHAVVVYDTESGRWAIEDESMRYYFPDGTVWDTEKREWGFFDSTPEMEIESFIFYQKLTNKLKEKEGE